MVLDMLENLPELATVAGDAVSAGSVFLGIGVGALLGFFLMRSRYESDSAAAKARKEGFREGREEGTNKGKKAYRGAVNAVATEWALKIEGKPPASGGHYVELTHEDVLDEIDQQAGYTPE